MLGVGEEPRESFKKVVELGLPTVQMGCPPEKYLAGRGWGELKEIIRQSGVTITTVFCGFAGESYADIPTVRRTVGLVPPDTRAERVAKTKAIIDFAHALGVKDVAAHIGFIPEDESDADFQELVQVMRGICDHADANGQNFCLETGQETAAALLNFIENVDRPNLKVNFDPANMILYGSGDPIDALELLGPYVEGVHAKDGTWPKEKDKLGSETPLGKGDVGIDRFIAKLKEIGYTGPLTIEREISGERQKQDILAAIGLLKSLI